ncbi:MAG: hypothetical protein Kow0069_32560 [Promethearchaeota archaeon]
MELEEAEGPRAPARPASERGTGSPPEDPAGWFLADEDLQRDDDDRRTRACKDLEFFLRRPFCCK